MPMSFIDGSPPIITPYSVATAVNPRIPQYALPTARNQPSRLQLKPSNEGKNMEHSTTPSTNLPDVLNRSQSSTQSTYLRNQERASEKPLTNVQRIAQDLQSMPKFQINLSLNRPQNQHLLAAPVYTATGVGHHNQSRRQIFDVPHLASPERDEDFELDMRGAAALPISTTAKNNQQIDCSSDHSGGSNETVEMDDIIEYADA